MDPGVLFWTAAFVNMGLVLGLAVLGVLRRRRGDVAGHRRRMLAAGLLVLAFLVGYVLKVVVLGREALEAWSPLAVWTLRLHELCVGTMLVAGGVAASAARVLRHTRNASGEPSDPLASPRVTRWHRRAGWVAVLAAAFGLATAALVLGGMYRRAGLL